MRMREVVHSRPCGGIAVAVVALLAGLVEPRPAAAHPWHRHRNSPAAAEQAHQPATDRDAVAGRVPAEPVAIAGPSPFLLTAAAKLQKSGAEIADAFAPFEKLQAVSCRRDDRWFYVESNGIPDHPLMVGIRAWQQQVPLPQPYVGDNAWQIPLHPVPAAEPATTKNRFLRGAIAVAVNGIPIFNPLNNRGEDSFAIGELDEYGGHCGRADDYHYHIAPVHLEKTVGKGRPIAYALDGYPIYGFTEPDGSPVKPLDGLGGHQDSDGNYHYHATKTYPYLNGGFRGEVTERDGQVDPQPRARGVREALQQLRGATIVGFSTTRPDTRKLTYEVAGRKGSVEYTVAADGSTAFTFTDPSGRTTQETYTPRGRGGPGGGRQRPGGGPRDEPGGDRPPPPPGRQPPPPPQSGPPRPRGSESSSSQADRPRAGGLVVTSPAVRPGENLPVEFTCDGAGVSPPLEWQPGPAGTKSYAVTLWHEAPDRVKSYWVVHGIPASVTRLPKDARGIGTTGLNDKRRAGYDPMCSKGPGAKTYHLTVHALSAEPRLPATGATRDDLLQAISGITLAEGTLTFTYDRGGTR